MKKLFALILAVAMICAMSVSVFAADETTTAHVVGSHGVNGTVADGLTDSGFAYVDPEVNVNITAQVGQVEHRYAVDITYDVMTFDIAGSTLVWNVNTLKYDVVTSGTLPTDKTFDVTVTNYSDLGVNLTVLVTDGVSDGATVAAYKDGTADALQTSAIPMNSALNGAVDFEFDVKVTADSNWDAVANYYAEYFTTHPSETSAIMGTMSITIAKLAGATPSAPVAP